MNIAHYLPAEHRSGCPAWDHWPCNCGAQPVPLVKISDARSYAEEAVKLEREAIAATFDNITQIRKFGVEIAAEIRARSDMKALREP